MAPASCRRRSACVPLGRVSLEDRLPRDIVAGTAAAQARGYPLAASGYETDGARGAVRAAQCRKDGARSARKPNKDGLLGAKGLRALRKSSSKASMDRQRRPLGLSWRALDLFRGGVGLLDQVEHRLRVRRLSHGFRFLVDPIMNWPGLFFTAGI